MFASTRSGVALSALLVSLVASGCRGAPQQLPRTESAGLGIEVGKVTKNNKRRTVDVRAKIWNSYDMRITFDRDQVRLMYGADEVAPSKASGKPHEVPAKSNSDFSWSFETPDALEEGTYTIEIRNIKKGDMPLGETAKFEVVVGR